MKEKIVLNKEKVVVFMGTMNAMPMMYASELRKLGYDVIYFVDAPKKDITARPENHYPDVNYPYPPWVVEFVIPSQAMLALFPRFFVSIYKNILRHLTDKEVGCFVLNGIFASLAPHLPRSARKIGLSHGSDLDVWADVENARNLCESHKNRSIFKFLPGFLSRRLIKYIVHRQYHGYVNTDKVVYFPTGFNKAGDRVIRNLLQDGISYVQRYDGSFEPLKGQSRELRAPSENMEIFSGVRFLYKTFPDGNYGYNKGNDIIIRGIADYYSTNKNIRVHFVEKGEDVLAAKALCRETGIEDVVVWHKEMPFKQLLELYQNCDICFDQVGSHWIGAIGVYALWLGKPLIANVEPAVRCGVWPEDNPVCSASSPGQICEWLKRLENLDFRAAVAERSKKFCELDMGPTPVLKEIFQYE